MQSDIVEELNESARSLIWLFNLENESGSIQTIREAATEITALRERVAKLEGALGQCAEAPHSGWTIAQAVARTALNDFPPATGGV